MSNILLEIIHQVLENLVCTYKITQHYANEYNPWSVILDSEAFAIFSTKKWLQHYIPFQFIFGRDMILPIKHKVD